MFTMPFKQKFVDYLVDGLPVSILSEEVPVFYKELDMFVNTAPNDFEASYSSTQNCLSIYDKYTEYLSVSYDDSRIIFRSDLQQSIQNHPDPETIMKMGEAFLGVIIFVESIAPSADSRVIPGYYRDKWIN